MQQLKKTRRKQNKQKTTEIKQKSFEKNNKNRNTGYPAQDPTANKYLSGSGWEIMYFCVVVSVVVCFRLVFVCLLCVVCVCSIVNAKA